MAKEKTEEPVTEENKNVEETNEVADTEAKTTEETAEANAETTEEIKEEAPAEEQELGKTKQELGEFKDKYLRLYSEFENYRRRTNKEKLEFLKQATKDLLLDLLPVIDDIDRADKHYDQENTTLDQVKEGYELIYKKLKGVLVKQGLTEMENTIGKEFDTEYHEFKKTVTRRHACRKEIITKY